MESTPQSSGTSSTDERKIFNSLCETIRAHGASGVDMTLRTLMDCPGFYNLEMDGVHLTSILRKILTASGIFPSERDANLFHQLFAKCKKSIVFDEVI